MFEAVPQILSLQNVHKSYGAVAGVTDISFSVSSGEIVSLLGPSGCGKTTTLRMIAGFEQPSSGNIEIAGRSAVGLKPYERNVGLVFQHFALFPHMTIYDNVAYGLKYRGVPVAEREGRVTDALKLVQLEAFKARKPAQLSGGQQQRVALARALVTQPSIMLLDEPLSALDAKLRQTLQVELRQILKSVNCSTIIVTHDQEEAMSLGDRLIVMNKGRIEQDGTPSEVYRRPSTEFVADFIGRASWLQGVIAEKHGGDRATVAIAGGETVKVRSDKPLNEAVKLCIRPEHIKVVAAEQAQAREADENLLKATVENVLYLGSTTQYSLALSSQNKLVVDVMGTELPAVDSSGSVAIRFKAADVTVL
ncbi:ABC transporter ATP-binding protein [Mesorhizobium sp. KR1-2]|uniref:ABC transporter ATP-binding protein n=1 Tax=Mesorhizobium sp. KR1-2 TaxID=3156609 RepID=UPI0032B40D8B